MTINSTGKISCMKKYERSSQKVRKSVRQSIKIYKNLFPEYILSDSELYCLLSATDLLVHFVSRNSYQIAKDGLTKLVWTYTCNDRQARDLQGFSFAWRLVVSKFLCVRVGSNHALHDTFQ